MARKTTKTTKSKTTQPTSTRRRTCKTAVASNAVTPAAAIMAPKSIDKPIGGKLGLVAGAVLKPAGASLDDLVTLTGWQPHTIRAALSRLRPRGIDARLTTVGDRKAYRVAVAEA
ncbi:MAG: DUF3489 domain-containing protein [Alphaproteobacteria bacterium]|nr:DUF3489 domain-containing protein [Alphaproteobacteria bacterium]